jgi:hypothetical protein
VVTYFELKRSASLVGIAYLSCLGNSQVGLDAVDNLVGLYDKVKAKDRPFARLDPVHSVRQQRPYKALKGIILSYPNNCCCKRTQPMADTCPICPGSSVHKLRAYPQEFDLPSPSDHRSADDKRSCGSNTSPRKHAAAPRSEQ